MRLSREQATAIRRKIVQRLPKVVNIVLFGSRTDDRRRGGDLDILIEVPGPVSLMSQAGLMRELEDATPYKQS
jgi:predicted nucleotidyltransferase